MRPPGYKHDNMTHLEVHGIRLQFDAVRSLAIFPGWVTGEVGEQEVATVINCKQHSRKSTTADVAYLNQEADRLRSAS
jgi:hypothetical protein